MNSAPSLDQCRERILVELADLRALSREELEAQVAEGGHRIDSQEADCVIAILEEKYHVEIPQIEEIQDVGTLTVAVLADHVRGGWSAKGVEDGGATR